MSFKVKCQTDPCIESRISGALTSLTPLTARVFLDTTVVTAAVNEQIVFGAGGVESNPGNIYNPATGEFTIPSPGLYAVNAQLGATNFGPVTYGSIVTVNGDPTTATDAAKSAHVVDVAVAAPDVESEELYWEQIFLPGDVIRLYSLCPAGTTFPAPVSNEKTSYMSLRLISC